MRRFLATSEKFNGHAELIYDEQEMICCVDMRNSNMNWDQRFFLLKNTPQTIANLNEYVKMTSLTIVEVDFEVTFDMFWEKYNRKINKGRCISLWSKLNKVDQVKAFFGIDKYEKFLKKEHWRPKADPETYLRNQYWLNEYK
jgi:hypothetical protein